MKTLAQIKALYKKLVGKDAKGKTTGAVLKELNEAIEVTVDATTKAITITRK